MKIFILLLRIRKISKAIELKIKQIDRLNGKKCNIKELTQLLAHVTKLKKRKQE